MADIVIFIILCVIMSKAKVSQIFYNKNRTFSATRNTSPFTNIKTSFISKTVKFSNPPLSSQTFRLAKDLIFHPVLRSEWIRSFSDYFDQSEFNPQIFNHFSTEIRILASDDFILRLLSLNTTSANVMTLVKNTPCVKSWNREQWLKAMETNVYVFDYIPHHLKDSTIIDKYNTMHKEYCLSESPSIEGVLMANPETLVKEHKVFGKFCVGVPGSAYYTSPVAQITFRAEKSALLTNIASVLVKEKWIAIILDEANAKYINHNFFSSFQNEISLLGRTVFMHLLAQNRMDVTNMLAVNQIYDTVNKTLTLDDWVQLFETNKYIYMYMPNELITPEMTKEVERENWYAFSQKSKPNLEQVGSCKRYSQDN